MKLLESEAVKKVCPFMNHYSVFPVEHPKYVHYQFGNCVGHKCIFWEKGEIENEGGCVKAV